MPGGDGTGPMGMGTMSGRGAGCCAGNAMPGFANYGGAGFRKGTGGGRGFRRMFCFTGAPGWAENGYVLPALNGQVQDKRTALKNQEEILELQLKQVKDRLKCFDEEK